MEFDILLFGEGSDGGREVRCPSFGLWLGCCWQDKVEPGARRTLLLREQAGPSVDDRLGPAYQSTLIQGPSERVDAGPRCVLHWA